MEIMREERDAVIYVGKASDIRWSGIELSIMLRKRLDQLGNFTSDANKRPRERLQQVLSERFPYVPQEVTASVGGREYRLDLFNYVLRHTFWRPREIIIYFARILLVLKDLNRKNAPVTRFTVVKCVADTARSVIGTEFINEFQHHCPGLVGIIEKFRAAPQIMSVAEVRQRLADVDFAFIDRDIPVQDFKSKMVFLYSIGFVGVEVTDELKQRRKLLNSDVFSFNETEDVAGELINEDLKDCGIIIHPAFYEYLSLDTSKQRLALNVDWEYLAQQEAHMFASI